MLCGWKTLTFKNKEGHNIKFDASADRVTLQHDNISPWQIEILLGILKL